MLDLEDVCHVLSSTWTDYKGGLIGLVRATLITNRCGILVLQCVAVCCSVLQCVAVCCNVLQCVAVCSHLLECVGVCCSVLQCAAVCRQSDSDHE